MKGRRKVNYIFYLSSCIFLFFFWFFSDFSDFSSFLQYYLKYIYFFILFISFSILMTFCIHFLNIFKHFWLKRKIFSFSENNNRNRFYVGLALTTYCECSILFFDFNLLVVLFKSLFMSFPLFGLSYFAFLSSCSFFHIFLAFFYWIYLWMNLFFSLCFLLFSSFFKSFLKFFSFHKTSFLIKIQKIIHFSHFIHKIKKDYTILNDVFLFIFFYDYYFLNKK